MIYSGSVVNVNPEDMEKAKEILKSYEQIDVFAVSDDKRQIVVAFETEGDSQLEDLCRELKSRPEIVDIGHHIFHFEEEVEEILAGNKVPSLDGFSKSSRKKNFED